MHWSQMIGVAVLIFGQRVEAISATGKYANFTAFILAVAGAWLILNRAYVQARKERMEASKGTDRAALAKSREECKELKADLVEVRAELAETRAELADARHDVAEFRDRMHVVDVQMAANRIEAARVAALLVEWAEWRLVKAPEIDPPAGINHSQPPPGPDRVILPDPTTATFPESIR